MPFLSTEFVNNTISRGAGRWVLALAVLVLSGTYLPQAAPWLLAVALGALLWVQALRTGRDDPFLRGFTLAAFGVRVAAMLALFFIALLGLPILEAYQLPGGFWAFAPDAKAYHELTAESIAQLRLGRPPSQAYGVGEGPYFYFLIALYYVFGTSPLNGLFVNCWAGAAVVPFAYSLGFRLGGRRGARMSAVFVGLWPSAAFWSTQLLKDPLVVVLMFALCAVVVDGLYAVVIDHARPRPLKVALIGAALGGLMISLKLFNLYVPLALLGAAILTLLPIAIGEFRNRRWRNAAAAIAVATVLIAALPIGNLVSLRRLVVRPHVETEFLAFGDQHLAAGRYADAVDQYEKALIINPLFKPAWLNMSIANRLAGNVQESDAQRASFSNIGVKNYYRVDPVARRPEDAPQTFPESMFRLASPDPMPDLASLAVVRALESSSGLHVAKLADTTDPRSAVLVEPLPGVTSALPPVAVARAEPGADSPALAAATPASAIPAAQPSTLPVPAAVPGPVTTSERAAPVAAQAPPVPQAAPADPASIRGRVEAVLLPRLNAVRQGFVDEGGASTEADVPGFSSLPALVAFVPRALQNVFFFPLPWQVSRGDGAERMFSAAESFVTLLLTPLFLAGAWRVVKRREPAGYLLLFAGLGLALLLGLAIPNLGTLFRKKIFALLPLLIVAVSMDPAVMFRRFRSVAAPKANQQSEHV